jgi:malonyl-CoA O-methyltransferase
MRLDFTRAANSYDEVAVLARETGQRMAERLDWLKFSPLSVADIGCATGDGIRELQRRYPEARPLAIDYSFAMLAAARARMPLLQRFLKRTPRWVNADVRALPLARGSVDLAWSNLVLHWLDDPLPAFRELHRVLATGGLLTFSMLGPDTLKELRAAGARSLRRFHDMHDIGDMLVAAGFADPVMDMEMIRMTYRRPHQFLSEQRRLGVRNGLLGQMPSREWRRVFAGWERDADGRLPATFEIVFGHAWRAEPKTTPDGQSIIRFAKP